VNAIIALLLLPRAAAVAACAANAIVAQQADINTQLKQRLYPSEAFFGDTGRNRAVIELQKCQATAKVWRT